MEDEHSVEGIEFLSRDTEVQSDDHGVEYHAELEDQEGGDLLLERAVAGRFVGFAVGFETFGAEFFLVRFCCGCSGFSVSRRGSRSVNMHVSGVGTGVSLAGDSRLNVRVVMDTVLDFYIALGNEIEQEDDNDRCQYNSWTPGVDGPAPRHAHACVGSDLPIRGIQEMDECCGDNHPRAEIASEEIDVERNSEPAHALGDHGKECYDCGDDPDDEEGGDAGAEFAIVFVVGEFEVADYSGRVGSGEINIVRVEAVAGGDWRGRHYWGSAGIGGLVPR